MPERNGSLRAFGFNRAAAAAALLFILASHLVRGTSYQDFTQYYMGGVMARTGSWDALYPIPLPDSIYNAAWGDPPQSIVRERYRELAAEHGIDEYGFRFIQTPPVALLFAPLTLLDYPRAYRVWMVILSLCMWGVSLQAGRVYREARGGVEDKGVGVMILVVACSVMAYRAVRVGNVSVIVALCIGVVVLDLVRPRAAWISGTAMTIGALAKYATSVLAPIHLVTKRWAPLVWAAAVLAILCIGTLALSGAGPFVEFARDIAPTLARSHPHRANQSIEGLLLRLTGHATLPPAWTLPLRAAQFLVLWVVVFLIVRRRRSLLADAPLVFAAAAALVCWLLIFGPLFWEHYPVYLCPLWGWLAWEARGSVWRAVVVVAAIAMAWVPVPAIQWIHLPEPINSHILVSTLLILGLALWRLGVRDQAAKG